MVLLTLCSIKQLILRNDFSKIQEIIEDGSYKEGVFTDIKGETAGHIATRRDASDILKLLLCSNVIDVNTPDRMGNSMVHVAATNNSICSLQILHQCGADLSILNPRGLSPAHRASRNNKHEIIQELHQLGADVLNCQNQESDMKTPLHFAVEFRKIESFRALCKLGPDFTLRDSHGWPPLFYILDEENLIFLKLILVEFKEKINLGTDHLGKNLLMEAIYMKKFLLVEFIILKDMVNLNHTDKKGEAAAHVCARFGFLDILEAMQCKRADLGLASIGGLTPAHLAAVGNHTEILEFLHANGYPLSVQDCKGYCPIDYAESRKSYAAWRYLKKFEKQTAIANSISSPEKYTDPFVNGCHPPLKLAKTKKYAELLAVKRR